MKFRLCTISIQSMEEYFLSRYGTDVNNSILLWKQKEVSVRAIMVYAIPFITVIYTKGIVTLKDVIFMKKKLWYYWYKEFVGLLPEEKLIYADMPLLQRLMSYSTDYYRERIQGCTGRKEKAKQYRNRWWRYASQQ